MERIVAPKAIVEGLDLDPTFEAGSTHTARATLTNPTTSEFTYLVELYLGVLKAATSGLGQVTIPAGESREMIFTVTMPIAEGDYQPYLDVHVGSGLVAHYAATALVTITVTPAIDIGTITWG